MAADAGENATEEGAHRQVAFRNYRTASTRLRLHRQWMLTGTNRIDVIGWSGDCYRATRTARRYVWTEYLFTLCSPLVLRPYLGAEWPE